MKRVRKAVADGRAGEEVKAYWMAEGMRACNDVVDHVAWHGDSAARRDMAKTIGKLVGDASGVQLCEKHADELRGLPNNHYLVLACAELEEERKELAHKESKRAAAARKRGAGASIEAVPLETEDARVEVVDAPKPNGQRPVTKRDERGLGELAEVIKSAPGYLERFDMSDPIVEADGDEGHDQDESSLWPEEWPRRAETATAVVVADTEHCAYAGNAEGYNPETMITDGDCLERGLSKLNGEDSVTAPEAITPAIPGQSGFNLARFECRFGSATCTRTACEVQSLSQLHCVECMRTGDGGKADELVARIATRLESATTSADASHEMKRDLQARVCCSSVDCKLAAGILGLEARALNNMSKKQDANQQAGNRRYGSDDLFKSEMALARRLLRNGTITKPVAMRMVHDTAQWSYWVESRTRETITMCDVMTRLPFWSWDTTTTQEFLDRFAGLVINYTIKVVGDHVTDPRHEGFGEYQKRGWDKMFCALLKQHYPDPVTSIHAWVKIKNWDVQGRPHDEKTKALVDRVSSNSTLLPLLSGAQNFHNAVGEAMTHRMDEKRQLRFAACEGGLADGSQTASHQQALRHVIKGTSETAAITRITIAKFMQQYGAFEQAPQTKDTLIHNSGNDPKKCFAPSSTCCFGTNNSSAMQKMTNFSLAFGCDADYGEFSNFTRDWLPNLYLQPSKDAANANGHVIRPSRVFDPEDVDGALSPADIAGRSVAEAVGTKTRQLERFGQPAALTVRGVISGRLGSEGARSSGGGIGGIGGSAPLRGASTQKSLARVVERYKALVKEGVLDDATYGLNAYATLGASHVFVQSHIAENRTAKTWFEHLRNDVLTRKPCPRPPAGHAPTAAERMRAREYEQAVQLKAALAGHEQWSPRVPRDPLNTANGPYPTWPKLRDERARLWQLAIDNVEDVNEVDYPLEPIHFEYWASRNGYDPRRRWPSELQLREDYANERLHEREVVVSRLLKRVESAAQRERQQVHRAFPKGATDAEIEEAEERRNRCEAPSEQWSQSWDLLEKESRDTDIGFRNTLVRWLRATERDESASLEERKIEEAFQAWLWSRFAGGMGRHLERQRAISAGKGDACPAREQERDRAMERAMREAAKGATHAREAPTECVGSYDGIDDDDDQDDDDEISRHLRAPEMAQADALVCDADARAVPTSVQDVVHQFSSIASTRPSTTGEYTNWRLRNHPTLGPNGRPHTR